MQSRTPIGLGSRGPAKGVVWLLAVLALALAVLTALGGFPASSADAQAAKATTTKKAKKATPASLTASAKASNVTATTARVRVTGTVKLPSTLRNTAKNRKKVKVQLKLSDSAKKTETRYGTLSSKRRYTITRTGTTLRGTLTATLRVRVSAKASGKAVTRKVRVVSSSTGSGGGGSTGGGSTGGGSTGGGTATPEPVPADARKLVGLFRLDDGTETATGTISGTYFRMFTPLTNGTNSPLPNQDSEARDLTYTLLHPGTDGGLRTDAYQPQPSPAFDGSTGDGGNALASRIIRPQTFFGIRFSVVTDAIDPQQGLADPLPEIYEKAGRLYGQTTAWNAQWNGESFNQGAPKPDGSLPAPTAVPTGTYDAASGRFVLEWRSLIVGGPFNNFSGFWHLEGTFVPAG